jgi:hypothetical protein
MGESIEGVLEDAAGAPARELVVVVRGERWSAQARTDEGGRFRIRGLPPGRYALLCDASGRAELGTAEAGAKDVRLRMPAR